jgi:hypothetical protein
MPSPIVPPWLSPEDREAIAERLEAADGLPRPDGNDDEAAGNAWATAMTETVAPVAELLRSRGIALNLDDPALAGSAAAYTVATMLAVMPPAPVPRRARTARRPRPRGAGRPGRRRVARRQGDSGDSDSSDDPEPPRIARGGGLRHVSHALDAFVERTLPEFLALPAGERAKAWSALRLEVERSRAPPDAPARLERGGRTRRRAEPALERLSAPA